MIKTNGSSQSSVALKLEEKLREKDELLDSVRAKLRELEQENDTLKVSQLLLMILP